MIFPRSSPCRPVAACNPGVTLIWPYPARETISLTRRRLAQRDSFHSARDPIAIYRGKIEKKRRTDGRMDGRFLFQRGGKIIVVEAYKRHYCLIYVYDVVRAIFCVPGKKEYIVLGNNSLWSISPRSFIVSRFLQSAHSYRCNLFSQRKTPRPI